MDVKIKTTKMEIKELRVGNWIYTGEGILCKINGFQPYDHSNRCDEEEGCLVLIDLYLQNGEVKYGYECNLHSSEPIPLTEEVLFRCGFDNKDYKHGYIGILHKCGGMFTDFVLTYPLQKGEWQNYFIWEHGSYKFNKIEFLHELQNLFHALTGEELTYNHSPSI